ncbi:alpha/beta hydrolase fold domain-containing protein [Butyrivibrio fibrisolvens]|uniref:alpha/beta hydrolase fold domain-containing protein n=1 Tax=Butyrivibrio fibrisolvens TaxID=831 RepID=UPI0003B3044C|nr:alpha/beta hydrolase fold domain-containing protein [Butyrivibrio fibrisolvens]
MKKAKYQLDKDLKFLENQALFPCIYVYPLVNLFLKGAVPEKKEYASPLEAQSFDQFPRTYIEVAEFDSLHDDGVLLADRLREEKIPVEFHEVKGSCHGCQLPHT